MGVADRVLEIMRLDPGPRLGGPRAGRTAGTAVKNLLTQMGQWVGYGFLYRTGPGAYSVTPRAAGT